MSSYFIGIDGGGTKTEAVLCDGSGYMLSRFVTGTSNLNGAEMNIVTNNISLAVSALLDTSGLSSGDITSVFAGIAGGINNRSAIFNILRILFPGSVIVDNNSDAYNILNCGLLGADGCGIISGTGSSCFVRRGGNYTQIGGWGYLIDKRGSGFDIGRDCIGAILRAYDGRGDVTLLSGLYTEVFGVSAENDITRIYSGGKNFIASAAPLVFRAAGEGDDIACQIIDDNMAGLAECIKAASGHFPDNKLPFLSVLGGGIFLNKAAINSLTRLVGSYTVLRPLECAPVFGAVVEAMKLAGTAANYNTLTTFKNSYKL